MYDSHTWPETRRSETFHSQASKLWEFVTEEMVSFYLITVGASLLQSNVIFYCNFCEFLCEVCSYLSHLDQQPARPW